MLDKLPIIQLNNTCIKPRNESVFDIINNFTNITTNQSIDTSQTNVVNLAAYIFKLSYR